MHQCGQASVSIERFNLIDSSVLPELSRSTEMGGELQVTVNTCLWTHMFKERVVIRFSTGSILDNLTPALICLENEDSLTDEALERNKVGLLFSYFDKNAIHAVTDLI